MPIKSICNPKVVTVQRASSIEDVSVLMQKYHVGSLVVVETLNGKLTPTGMITDRDIALAIGSMNPRTTRVEQIMQRQPITAKENDGIYETIVKMNQYGIKRMPVVREDGALCGLVTADDLFSMIGEEITKLSTINEKQLRNEKGMNAQSEEHAY